MERLGVLTGQEAKSKLAAQQFRDKLAAIKTHYQTPNGKKIPSVFFQIARKPLMTINEQHLLSEAIHLCGGQNIFGNLKEFSATISLESVFAANPDVIVTAGDKPEALDDWRRYTQLSAVSKNQLFVVNGDLIHRAGPRILQGTEILCKQMHEAKAK